MMLSRNAFRVFFSVSDSNIAESPWVRADLNVQLMKYISVGPAGIFVSHAKDESVWGRVHMQSGKPTTKVNMDEGRGDGWNKLANVSCQASYLTVIGLQQHDTIDD